MIRALVLGGGECVWSDLDRLERLIGHEWDGVVVAVNDVSVHWPRRLDAIVSLHPDRIRGWVQQRLEEGHPEASKLWSRSTVSARFQRQGVHQGMVWGGGSSGMLGASVAVLGYGAERVVLCGVPLTRTPHFQESRVHQRGKVWTPADGHFKVWRREAHRMRGVVRSMSGRTRELLGGPTRPWLGEAA